MAKLIKQEDIKDLPDLDRDTMVELAKAIEKVADFEKAESFEEFLGMRIARKIYKELLRIKKIKKEVAEQRSI